MKNLLQLFIVIIPVIISFSTLDPTLSIRFLSLSLLVTIISGYFLFFKKTIYKQSLKSTVVILFAFIIITNLASTFFNRFSSESIYILLKMFLLYIFLLIMVQLVQKEGHKPLLKPFLFFSLILSIIYFSQLILNYTDILKIKDLAQRDLAFDSISASMGHKNLLSAIQFLVLPFLIYLFITSKRLFKTLSLLAIILIGLTLVQTQSRAVILAVFLATISFFLVSKNKLDIKRIGILILSSILILFIFYGLLRYTNRYNAFEREVVKTLDFNESARFKLYKNTTRLIIDNPILGVGPGNWSTEVWRYGLYFGTKGDSFAQRPHNDFLWIFAEGGIFAGISYILIFLILIRDAYLLHKNREDKSDIFYSLLFSTLIGYAAISFFDFPLERISHNVIFLALASVIIASRLKEKTSNQDKLPSSLKYIVFFIALFSTHTAIKRYKAEVHLSNAIEYKAKGNWHQVIKEIDQAYSNMYCQTDNTTTPLPWYRGIAYFNQKRFDLALQDFKIAHEINPYHVHVLNNLATSYEMKGKHEKAKQYYNKVFEFSPTFKEARVNLSAILYNEKDYTQALDVILKSRIDPYKERVANNDNYDLYLKTIFNSWVNSVYDLADSDQVEILERVRKQFEDNPQEAEIILRKTILKRRLMQVDYLSALCGVIRYEDKIRK